jgi:hypothetical protein
VKNTASGGWRHSRKVDAELAGRIVTFAEQRRCEGASWRAIATELGASEIVRRWCGDGTLVLGDQFGSPKSISVDAIGGALGVGSSRGAKTGSCGASTARCAASSCARAREAKTRRIVRPRANPEAEKLDGRSEK